ncbi:MAG: glycosyltransferase family 4 protein [Vicinamibacterales bacterium]
MTRLRVLHAIHDFLPRHRAGSEIYASELCRELARGHDVFVVCAEHDLTAPHGTIRWRLYEGLPVIEIVNNWQSDQFEETYLAPRIMAQLEHVLDVTRPDVLHVHNLLNLSFDLPRRARARGIATVATLHDYTLVCAAGGQRVHVAEAHLCETIEPERCSRCVQDSMLHAQTVAAGFARGPAGALFRWAAPIVRRTLPVLTDAAARRLPKPAATPQQLASRLDRAVRVFSEIDRFVAPSSALADEYRRLGLPDDRLEVSDYGFVHMERAPRAMARGSVRFGFVGTLAWHKGAHVLIEAARGLRGSFEVTIAGDPNVGPEYAARLKRAATGLPIRFSGRFEREGLPAAYAGIDVLIVPSLWLENSPLVIHEAFMHGVAVVGSRLGGILDLVVDEVNGLTFEAGSATALAATLQRFIDDPDLAARLASHAPDVKSIEDDAREWVTRYAAVLRARQGS